MQHVDQPTLDAVLSHTLSAAQLARIKEHVRGCRLCARRLEEYRDLFSEVEVIIPTAERDVVAKRGSTGSWREVLTPRLDDALPSNSRLLQIGMGFATVLVLGVVVFLVRSPSPKMTPIVLPATPRPVVAPPASPAPAAPARTEATLGAGVPAQPTPALPEPIRSAPPKPTSAAAPRKSSAPPRPQNAETIPQETAAAAPPADGHTPLFHRVESTEAIGALGGSMRLIDGVTPDHFEMAPGTVVPGAAETLPVVRVVYKLYGGTVLLDQQRNPEQASRESASGTAPEGVSVLRWSSGEFWLTLAGQVPADSLELLARRVK
jgi:hypothetical protein